MTIEEIFLAALVLFTVLFTAVTLWLRTFTEADGPPPPEPKPSQAAPQIPRAGPPRSGPRGLPAGTPLSAAESVAALRPARAWVGDLHDIRRGMILMAILGPCRGLERDNRDDRRFSG